MKLLLCCLLLGAIIQDAVILPNGKKVILNPDRTWRYADETTATLRIEAALRFRNGDVKPAARIEFLILDQYVGKILHDAGLKWENETFTDERLAKAYAIYDRNADPEFFKKADALIKPHIIASGKTDFSGKVSIVVKSPGRYFLFGVYLVGENGAVWNKKLDLKPGDNHLILSEQDESYKPN